MIEKKMWRSSREKRIKAGFLCLRFSSVCQPDSNPRQDRNFRCGLQSRNGDPYGGRSCDGVDDGLCDGKQKEIHKLTAKELLFICCSGIATGASWLCYYRALKEGPAGVVVPVDKLSVLVTVAFSYFVFGEN